MHFLSLLDYSTPICSLFTDIGTPAAWFNHTRREQNESGKLRDYYPARTNGTKIPVETLRQVLESPVMTYWPSAVIYLVSRGDGLTLLHGRRREVIQGMMSSLLQNMCTAKTYLCIMLATKTAL